MILPDIAQLSCTQREERRKEEKKLKEAEKKMEEAKKEEKRMKSLRNTGRPGKSRGREAEKGNKAVDAA